MDLKPNGGSECVTFVTRHEYVHLYVTYLMHASVAAQFAAFARGFRKVGVSVVVVVSLFVSHWLSLCLPRRSLVHTPNLIPFAQLCSALLYL